MKRNIFILLFFAANNSFSQEYKLPQTVWAPAGGFASENNYDISWSIGDALVFSGINENNVVTNGFVQPMICKTEPIITAFNTITCAKPYTLKASPGFQYYRWKLDTSLIANEKDSAYSPITNARYSVFVGDSTGCYLSSPYFETDFTTKRGVTTITAFSNQGKDTLLLTSEGLSYQWYIVTPEDGVSRAISNANTKSFRPYYNGTYFVKLHSEDHCISYSPQYKVNNTGQEILNRELYSINDTSIFFKYNISQNYKLQLYPNPSANFFYVDYESPVEKQLLIIIYDVLGVEIERREISKSSQTIKEYFINTDWRPGIYSVKVNDGSKVSVEHLIVNWE